jgi:hypothetical protein
MAKSHLRKIVCNDPFVTYIELRIELKHMEMNVCIRQLNHPAVVRSVLNYVPTISIVLWQL